jgi:tetratricopeptide (TPR) repeat protein
MAKKLKSPQGHKKKNAGSKLRSGSVKSTIAPLKKIKAAAAKSQKHKSGKKPKALATRAPKAAPRPPVRVPSQQFAGAVAALEAGIKLMYAEDYAKAVRAFNKVIAEYGEEPEIQASAKARIHACEMKLQERARAVYRTADDHYNVAVAMMNSGELDTAITHLQSGLKLAPKADHILYAMAAANALKGNRDQALSFLKQAIQRRPENRFQALQDNDFAVLAEEQAFKDLVATPDK